MESNPPIIAVPTAREQPMASAGALLPVTMTTGRIRYCKIGAARLNRGGPPSIRLKSWSGRADARVPSAGKGCGMSFAVGIFSTLATCFPRSGGSPRPAFSAIDFPSVRPDGLLDSLFRRPWVFCGRPWYILGEQHTSVAHGEVAVPKASFGSPSGAVSGGGPGRPRLGNSPRPRADAVRGRSTHCSRP